MITTHVYIWPERGDVNYFLSKLAPTFCPDIFCKIIKFKIKIINCKKIFKWNERFERQSKLLF